ncbi:MAG: hypothetical protein AB7V46_20910, partial [Thermomicrobiales bacterium]
ESARPSQRFANYIHTNEQERPVARLCTIRASKGRVVVVSPPVKAKQNAAICFNRAEIIMGRLSGGQSQERLMPRKATDHVHDAYDCPQARHCCSCGLTTELSAPSTGAGWWHFIDHGRARARH